MKFYAVLLIALIAVQAADQKTREGCTCKSNCGATIDFGFSDYDWCYTENKCGHYSLTRFSYYDYCVYPPDTVYEANTAAYKTDNLWTQITAVESQGNWPNAGGLLTESVKTSFDDYSDVMPAGRTKYIHSVGAVAQVQFVAEKDSPYTGVLAGADYGLLRLSTARPIDSTQITPGLGFKLLRDGQTSANLMAMPFLDGQTDYNIWKYNYTNHVPLPKSLALKSLVVKFKQASNCPTIVGLSDFAAYGPDGSTVSDSKFPYELIFMPDPDTLDPFPSTQFTSAEMIDMLSELEVGTSLFKVYAHETPAKRNAGEEPDLIGHVVIKEQFAGSKFGDEQLLFRHQYFEEDIAIHEDWVDDMDVKNECGTSHVGPTPPSLAMDDDE